MEYTEEQRAAFKQQFAERRRRQIILAVPLALLFVAFAVFSDDRTPGAVLGVPVAIAGPILGVLVVAALAFSFWNWRCPACNKYLGKGIGPLFCPKCGVPLR